MKPPEFRVKGRTLSTSGSSQLHPAQLRDPSSPPITLLTDFGSADYFVGSMKGVILSVNPQATVVDVTHDVGPQDIEAAAFILLAGYHAFPAGTIHVAVVDPGVGSGRRPILLQAGNHYFVGPDNGIFSYVCDQESDFHFFSITNEKYFRQPVSATFHGRDIFAPVAAVLSLGVEPRELGNMINDPVRLESVRPSIMKNGKLNGRVIHIDRFGNCITNITRHDFTEPGLLQVAGKSIKSFRRFFADRGRDKLFGVWGSAGFLEIAANNASAAKILGIKRGARVVVTTKERLQLRH